MRWCGLKFSFHVFLNQIYKGWSTVVKYHVTLSINFGVIPPSRGDNLLSASVSSDIEMTIPGLGFTIQFHYDLDQIDGFRFSCG